MLNRQTLYFAYGANISVDDMAYRCPKAQAVGPFELYNWQLNFYSHATIEPCAGASVHGVLWKLTDQCEHSLDMFEGFPRYYTKRLWQQDKHQIFFYEMTDPKTGTPSRGYIRGIADGYKHWSLPNIGLSDAIKRSHKHDVYSDFR